MDELDFDEEMNYILYNCYTGKKERDGKNLLPTVRS
jgi:hypothetical protein